MEDCQGTMIIKDVGDPGYSVKISGMKGEFEPRDIKIHVRGGLVSLSNLIRSELVLRGIAAKMGDMTKTEEEPKKNELQKMPL